MSDITTAIVKSFLNHPCPSAKALLACLASLGRLSIKAALADEIAATAERLDAILTDLPAASADVVLAALKAVTLGDA